MSSLHDLIVAVREVANSEPDSMITLTHHSDDSQWLQLLPDKVNVSYPFRQSPADLIDDLNFPHRDRVVEGFWEAELFADFETHAMTTDQLVDFINAYLSEAFGTKCLEDFDVSFEVADRGTLVAESNTEFLQKIVALKRYFEGRPNRH